MQRSTNATLGRNKLIKPVAQVMGTTAEGLHWPLTSLCNSTAQVLLGFYKSNRLTNGHCSMMTRSR